MTSEIIYGDAIAAIKKTGLSIIQIDAEASSLDILQRLLEAADLGFTPRTLFSTGPADPLNSTRPSPSTGCSYPHANRSEPAFFSKSEFLN